MENHKALFREEAHELLAELEDALLALEENPDDGDLVSRVFRAMHTIKGSGAMFGFDAIAEFTHEVETVFDQVREGKLPVTPHLVNLGLSARDHIKGLLDADAQGGGIDTNKGDEIIREFKSLRAAMDTTEPGLEGEVVFPAEATLEPGSEALSADTDEEETTWRIRFRPHPNLLANGTNPVLLLKELRELGDCHIVAQTDLIPQPDQIDPEQCYLFWDIILTTDRGIDAIRDVFIFVEDDCDLSIDIIDEEDLAQEDYKRLGEILVERGDVASEDLKQLLDGQKRIGQMLVESKLVCGGAIESALLEQNIVKGKRQQRKEEQSASSVRVAADKLDTLVNLVGELVTVQARLSQKAVLRNDPDLLAVSEEVERLTAELRDNAMSIRMLPIGSTFRKFKRLVRDLSGELGKEVNLTTSGGETELDKTVIEQLSDPLVHIIRNSIDHGIESPAERGAAGKPAAGTVHLAAMHSGAYVLIRVSDDGAGLNSTKIREKALQKGLISPDADLSEKDIYQLVFMPGFSTAAKLSDVSGRGVGMDVVKQRIEALRGSVEVESRPGAGTTLTLKLPLTLAIIDGFLVQIGEGRFVLPLSAVEECLELTRAEADRAQERNMINLRGEVVSFMGLRRFFKIEEEAPEFEQVVVAEANGMRIGFGVDRFIGQHQTVIKSLGKAYKGIREISGATILGDGTVALILDIPQLVETFQGSLSQVA
jgi:two-component system chemotaxis sensor kinase CheA